MRKLYMSAFTMCTILGLSAQEVLWQKDIKSSTQDFLSQVTTTIDQQYLITGSSIQSNPSISSETSNQKQNNGYDFHLVKLNQQGEEVWEKYISGNNHDYLSATVSTQDGGFLISGTSYSGKNKDKKDESKGGSDIWLIRLNEFGDELWQKTLGSASDEEARSVIQTTDLGFFVAGNVQNSAKGYGSKDILIVKLDKDGKELSHSILGGKGLDEVEKMIPTKDGGALLGIYSRSATGGSKKTENFGEGDYWVIKLDKTGKTEWEKSFGGKA
ncbi:T9SS type A sorting domain-containing protein, partial [Chryseobacterium sp. 22532]